MSEKRNRGSALSLLMERMDVTRTLYPKKSEVGEFVAKKLLHEIALELDESNLGTLNDVITRALEEYEEWRSKAKWKEWPVKEK
tara:strand:- start:482 stop:733 length:252 start_codon:yes stop_codon:yes gene_type:complete